MPRYVRAAGIRADLGDAVHYGTLATNALTPLTLASMSRCGDGRLAGHDRVVESISIDSRTLTAGALFVALKGELADGHDFAAAAAARGASGLLVERELPIDLPQVVVPDTLAALTACARARRRDFAGPVVAVTGSNGKTTTKEMIGAILTVRGPSLMTRGNLNHHIGVPLTLLSLRPEHTHAVVEMGANHRGEIAHLMSIAQPGIGIVTNAGAAHLEGFGSLDGVAEGKGELFAALPRDGVAVLNADDRYASRWRSLAAGRRIVTFGLDDADYSARKVRSSLEQGVPRVEFDLVTPGGTVRIELALAGMHNLRNALGAAAAAQAAGASLEEVAAGLGAVRPVKGRLEFRPAVNGAVLVDDSYNANPGSLKAGLDACRSFAGSRWLVLGDMMELGTAADELHREIGAYARESGVERLLAVGPRAKRAADEFGPGGAWFETVEDLITEARRSLRADVAVLVKGSRANRLERVTQALAPESSEAS
jgi:UDP-N-acetylmuramoyl-tripeptide--D-alanyl-D-alanine ligase